MTPPDIEKFPLTGRFLMGRLRHALSEHEKRIVESLVGRVERFTGPATLLRRGEVATQSALVLEGMLLRTIEQRGRRFVVGLQVPGDFADLHGFALKRLDHDVVTVGQCTVGFVDHRLLERMMAEQPHLTRLFWFASLLDAAIHREWILKLEEATAARRVAHVFAELWCRLDLVGLGRPDELPTPLTQLDLADMCGTTAIHMNRALGHLKREGIAEFRRGTVHVPDRAALEEFGGFDPSYLYGPGELRVGPELTRVPDKADSAAAG